MMTIEEIQKDIKENGGKIENCDLNTIKAFRAHVITNHKLQASVYHDDKDPARLNSIYFNPIRRISEIADKVLQEVSIDEVITPNLLQVNFMVDGQVAKGSRIACDQLFEMFGVDYVHFGQITQDLNKFGAKMLIDHVQAKRPHIVEAVSDKISQRLIALKNKYIINLLDKVATTAGHVIETPQFDPDNINSAAEIINNYGYDVANVICSSEFKNATNTWDLSPWETYATHAQTGKADFNQPVDNSISYLTHKNLLGFNWIAIPSKDVYKIIQPNVAYVLTTPDKLGQFTSRLDTPAGFTVPNVNGVEYAMIESFAAKIFNTATVVKIKKI